MRNKGVFITFTLFLVTNPHAGDSLVIVIVTTIDKKMVGVEIS